MDASWCEDISTKRKSLMHAENDTITYAFMNQSLSTGTENRWTRSGQCSTRYNRPKRVVGGNASELISQQYSSRNGILVRRDKDLTFLEINFDVREPDLDAILEKGVAFDDHSVVIPCIARKVNAVYVRLYNLPLWNKDELSHLIFSSVEKYGDVLDVGMLLEPNTDTYMGSGYAIIDTEYRSETRLNHIITNPQKRKEFYGVWDDMPYFCHCCHSKNHVFEECSKREAGVVYPEPVFKTKMDKKEEYAYRNYIRFILNKDREYIVVKIKTLTDKSDIFKIRRDCQVLGLKEIYSKEIGIPVHLLRFMCHGQLEDDRTLAYHNIEDGDTIHFVKRLLS